MKTYLITGASKGIGRQLALQLASTNTQLALIARSANALNQLQEELSSTGASVRIYAGSVANETFVTQTVADVVKAFGHITALVNNAGHGIFGSVENIEASQWDELMATNAKGTFLFCKAVLPFMKKAKSGHIVNIASDVARRVFEGGSLYCASKYAQDAFSMALRKEVRSWSIKVSVVYSGLVDTEFYAHPQGDPVATHWLKASDVANAITYILSAPAHVVIDELMTHPLSQDY